MRESDDEEEEYNFKTLYTHMHQESKRKYVHSSCDVAKTVRNIKLNRYNNVAPYDSHRVILSTVDETDYINASCATSSSFPDQLYILAQGPLPQTCGDFWRMAWEKNCLTIVMLNKLIENGRRKCARYWPEEINSHLKFEVADLTFTVTLLELRQDGDRFVIRHLELSRSQAGESEPSTRKITHFHYVAWPDFGVPDTPRDFGEFFYTLEAHKCFSIVDTPSIVHCSAGIGRTGTLVLVDSCLKKLRKDKRGMLEFPDIIQLAYEEIIFLRQFRMGLIQTSDQFEFSIRSIEYLHNNHLKRMREQMPIDSDASGDGLQVEIESGPRQSPTHNARPFSSDEEQTKTLNPSDSEAHPSDPNIGKALAGHQPAPQPEPIKPQDVVMNKHERQAKIAQIKDSMKKSENKKEFWDFWTIPLAVVGCSIGVVLIGYGIHHYYPSESAIEDIIDMEVTIEDEL